MLELEFSNSVLTAHLSGELDHHTAAVIRKKIDSKAEALRPKTLTLDYQNVQFMDSSGIGLIMGRYRQMSLIGGTVEVKNVPPHLKRMFSLSGIDTLGVIK